MPGLVTSTLLAPFDDDLPLLDDAFGAIGTEAMVVAWDDPDVDWASFECCILRSTWDYVVRYDEFLGWVGRTSSCTRLWNTPDVTRWNTDKRYLHELSAAGVPTVPTTYVRHGEQTPALDRDTSFVVKPTVGAGAHGVAKLHGGGVAAYVDGLHAEGLTAIIQPYVDLIDDQGETMLVYLGDGQQLVFSHAVRKRAILGGEPELEAGFIAVEEVAPHTARDDELAVGAAVLAAAPVERLGPLAYARVDLVPSPSGPLLLELELTEPSLHLATAPGSADRAARLWSRLPSSR